MQGWDEWGYLACGVTTAAPLAIYPLLRPGDADRGKPLSERFWVKANVWHAVFGFVGNYFWTHYFFQLLGASYTMPSHRLNQARFAFIEIGAGHLRQSLSACSGHLHACS